MPLCATQFRRWTTPLLVSGVLSSVLFAASAAAQTREQAVTAAREGRLEEGISILRALVTAGDASPDTAYDLAVVLTWANHPKEETDAFEQAGNLDAPEYVLLAMTRAYWDQRRYDEAQRLARRGRAAFPSTSDWIKLSGLIAGEAADRSGDPYTALRLYAQARRELPDDEALQKAAAGVLARLGAPYAAASALGQPDAGIEAQEAAMLVRWGSQVRPRQPELRFAGTDAALARLDELIDKAMGAERPDVGLLARLRRDRVVALRDRERWADAVVQAQELRRSGDQLPMYARQAEADALLALRRPGDARRAYQDLIDADPKNQSALIGRFFAEIEEEDFRAAFATIDASAASYQPTRRVSDTAATLPDPDWLGVRITAGQARNFADMNADAWQRLFPLSQQAPALGYLRSAVGSVTAARGWPRLAAEEVEIAATLAPEDVGGQIALADSAFRLREYDQARQRAADLARLYPDNASVQRLVREINSFDRFEFRTESHTYNENGAVVTDAPGNGFDTTNRIYSPPLGDNWRLLGGFDVAYARPEEGLVNRYRTGGGLEWRIPTFTMEATGWANTGTLQRGSARVEAGWTVSDHWNLGTDVELYSIDTPLRAVLNGITANSVGVNAGYDWHESTGWAANGRAMEFSDGNHRLSGGFNFVHRLVDRAHLKIAVRPEIYASSNTRTDVPYFNPARDLSFIPGFDVVHLLSRRYEHSFRQHLNAGIGSYSQRGFGTGAISNVTYEQIYEVSPGTDLRYGATYARRLYDGDAVNSLALLFGLTRKL